MSLALLGIMEPTLNDECFLSYFAKPAFLVFSKNNFMKIL